MNLLVEQYETIPITKEISMTGVSSAGIMTSFIFKPFNFMIDFGSRTNKTSTVGFLTHQHSDHSLMIPNFCSSNKEMTKTLVIPVESYEIICGFIKSRYLLNHPEMHGITDSALRSLLNFKIIPAYPGQIINSDVLSNDSTKRFPFNVEVLQAYHSVMSLGYGFSTVKRKLKPEAKEFIKESKIQSMKDALDNFEMVNGEAYNYDVKYEFVFYCDSSIHNLIKHDEWKKYPVVICECTGFQKISNGTVYKEGHTKIGELIPIMLENIDKKWILIHTNHYTPKEEKEELCNEIKSMGVDLTFV